MVIFIALDKNVDFSTKSVTKMVIFPPKLPALMLIIKSGVFLEFFFESPFFPLALSDWCFTCMAEALP